MTIVTACGGGSSSSGSAKPTTSAPAVPTPVPQTDDPYTPGDGNVGYDVRNYDLDLSIEPGDAAKELDGTATITAKATQRLDRFNLDLTGLKVTGVTVGGSAATHDRQGSELIITPGKPITKGSPFTVKVAYSGTPKAVDDPVLGTYGWIRTPDGVFVACQPSGAHTWFPANDHPSDKATFSYTVSVPRDRTVIAGGDQTGQKTANGRTTYRWRVKEPMTTYLATINIGKFKIEKGETPGGIPILSAVDSSVTGNDVKAFNRKTAEITDEWVKLFGPYPFSSTGGLIDNANVRFALETQTRSVYGNFKVGSGIIAHELAHQWFGDSVSLNRWQDIWLNEGFATYAEWMWEARDGSLTVQDRFDQLYDSSEPELWAVPPGDPGRRRLFHRSVYDRGAMTLHALRKQVGDDPFFKILRTWTAEHRHGNASTPQFIALAERLSGKKLGPFFQSWLYGNSRPSR